MIKIFTLSEYREFDSAYWGLGNSLNGTLYFGLCTHQPNKNAGIFSFDPSSGNIKKIANLSTFLPKTDIAFQGKVHTPLFVYKDSQIFFGTQFAYPHGIPQEVNYSGGHILSLNINTGKSIDHGIPIPREGILSMTLDKKNWVIYCLTAPSGFFVSYNIESKKYKNYGQIVNSGSICRSLVLDKDNNVYGSIEKNRIFMFDRKNKSLKVIPTTLPTSDTSIPEWSSSSRRGVNKIGRNIWRTAVFNKGDSKVYGIHAGTSSLFMFDPSNQKTEDIGYFGPKGYKNHLDKIYSTLSLAIYKNTLLYIPTSGLFDYARSENIKEFSHLMKYSIRSKKIVDHGTIADASGRKIYGVAGSTVSSDGTYYLLGAVEVFKNERYNRQNVFENKPYHLGLISIKI